MRDLPKASWESYLARLSKHPLLKGAEVDVSALNLGEQTQTEWVKLRALTYDRDGTLEVELEGPRRLSLRPKQISVEDASGTLTAFTIRSPSDVSHTIKLRRPLALTVEASPSDEVDEAGTESFPASDPPAWTG